MEEKEESLQGEEDVSGRKEKRQRKNNTGGKRTKWMRKMETRRRTSEERSQRMKTETLRTRRHTREKRWKNYNKGEKKERQRGMRRQETSRGCDYERDEEGRLGDTRGENYLNLSPKTVARHFPRGSGRNLIKEEEEDRNFLIPRPFPLPPRFFRKFPA